MGTEVEPTNQQVMAAVESMRKDSTLQYGEIKKEFGAFAKTQDRHENEINKLKEDKVKRDAIEEYKKNTPSSDSTSGTLALNKELLKAIGLLVTVIGAIGAMYLGLK